MSLLIACLLFHSASYATEEDTATAANTESAENTAPPQATVPLTLNTDVNVPHALWRNTDSPEAAQAVPTMAIMPAPALEPPPLTNVTLMLDWYLSPQHAALLIAQELGLYARQGIALDIQSPADPSIAVKLLAAGEIDLALTRQPLLHLQVHNGAPITRIATLIETSLTAVIVKGDEQTDIENNLAELHYGYTTAEGSQLSIPRLLPRSVQQTDDFTAPINVHFDPIRALREGQIDAVADGFYHYLPPQLATEGISTHIIRYDELDIPRHDGLIVLANNESLGRRAETWSRFTLALEEASHWIIDNPTAAWELLINAYPVLENDVNSAAWNDILRRMALSPAALDSHRYEAFETFLLKAGVIETALPISRLAVNPHAL